VGPDEDSTRPAEDREPGQTRLAPADAVLSVEGMRAAFSSGAGETALLQCQMPARGAAMVALGGATELLNGSRKRQT
jgi:hypothetical protein